MYAAAMFAGSVTGTLADAQHFQRVMRAGFRLRSLLAARLHSQVLRLTPAARAGFTSGRMYNLLAADAETLQTLCQGAFGFISAPLRITG